MRRLLSICIASLCSLAAARADTVAVLPFVNDSSLSGLDWIGESIAETVDAALEAQGMLVNGREDRQEAYRRLSIRPNAHLTHASVLKVAEELDATDVVCGTFELTPPPEGAPAGARGTLHLKAWTVNMRRMRRGPEFLESGPLDELAALQSHLAWQVLHYLAPETTPSAEEFLKERPPLRLDAMENYTRGLLASGSEQKHRYFTQAARLDARLSEAGFELGMLYWKQKEYRLAAQWFSKVASPATRHLEASFLLGLCHYYLGEYDTAQEAFARVAASVPLNEVFNNLGAAQSRLNLPLAAGNFQKALEGDPADPNYHFNLGFALWKQGNYESAAQSFRATLDRDPEDAQATLMLGRCLKRATPTPADLKAGFERLKLNYEEGPWRQLKAALETGKPKPER